MIKNPWFRMYAEFAHDPKVQMLSEVDQRRFIMLLCLRCSNGDVTLHETLHETEVAFQLRISDEEWAKTKATLMAKKLIDEDNEPLGWEKRQSTDYLRLSPEVWKKVRRVVFERDNYTCSYCGARGVKLECDHIVPLARGGTNEFDNLATACRPCNRSKHTKTLEEWEVAKNG